MNENLSIEENIEKLIEKLNKNDDWGTYFTGKYFFTIVAHKSKEELGIELEPKAISHEIQLRLQKENYAALFHEYIHFLHEMSTIIGSFGLSLDLSLKSLFSMSLDKNPSSSKSLGLKLQPELYDKFVKFFTTQGVIDGGMADELIGKMLNVISINYEKQPIYVPDVSGIAEGEIEIPLITYNSTDNNGNIITANIHIGKYYIYEGLAYELDRIVDKNIRELSNIDDDALGTEYTVLRKLSKFIFPEVETITYLSVASLSLQYINCGKAFIDMLVRIKNECSNGGTQNISIKNLKGEISTLLKKAKPNFIHSQNEFKNVFLKRQRLTKAFTYLTDKMINIYQIRIQQPTFEVDYVLDGRFRELLDDIIQICDYMYIFEGKDEYMRDFLGTSIDLDTSDALKVLLAYDDYYKAHRCYKTEDIESRMPRKCPFYTCCNLSIRKTQSEICRTKPWRIFEFSSYNDHQYCWYGQGVLELKGVNES